MGNRISIEKKSIGPAPLPDYEAHNRERHGVRDASKIMPWWLVFSREIGPREEVTILAHAQLVFKGHRLSVDPSIAPYFQVRDVRVGKNSFSINGHHGVAATLFPPLPDKLTAEEKEDYEQLLLMNLDTAQVTQTHGLTVFNTSYEKRYFSAILWGTSLEHD